jgi:hypothetical protein
MCHPWAVGAHPIPPTYHNFYLILAFCVLQLLHHGPAWTAAGSWNCSKALCMGSEWRSNNAAASDTEPDLYSNMKYQRRWNSISPLWPSEIPGSLVRVAERVAEDSLIKIWSEGTYQIPTYSVSDYDFIVFKFVAVEDALVVVHFHVVMDVLLVLDDI